MKLGANDINDLKLGNLQVDKVYLGEDLVWSNFAYDIDYQAILDRATTLGYTLPSDSQKIIQNQLILDLKSNGIWSKLDVFYVFANDGSEEFATLNWKNPLLHQCTLINSPSFITNIGFQGNGTSSYIVTNFTPSVDGVNYQQDNASRYYWLSVAPTVGFRIDGTSDASLHLNSSRYQNIANQFVNSNNTLNTVFNMPSFGTGMFGFNRTSNTNIEIFADTSQTSRTQTSTGLSTQSQFIFRQGGVYSNAQLSFYSMGASLVSENTNFFNSINTYLTSI